MFYNQMCLNYTHLFKPKLSPIKVSGKNILQLHLNRESCVCGWIPNHIFMQEHKKSEFHSTVNNALILYIHLIKWD